MLALEYVDDFLHNGRKARLILDVGFPLSGALFCCDLLYLGANGR